MERNEGELTGKTKLVFEAVAKIQQGNKLVEEGKIELASLLGESKPQKRLTAGQKSAITKKLLAERESNFRKDTRTDEEVKEKIVNLIRKNREVTSILVQKKLKLSGRRLMRLLGQLSGENVIVNQGTGVDKSRYRWTLVTKPINGHRFKKKSPGGGGRRSSFIDVTKPEYIDKTLALLKTDNWVTKSKLIETIDVSAGVANRLTDYLRKQKLIIPVMKKHNPAHKNSPKNYERSMQYWAAA